MTQRSVDEKDEVVGQIQKKIKLSSQACQQFFLLT
jgi:hypothetical protein